MALHIPTVTVQEMTLDYYTWINLDQSITYHSLINQVFILHTETLRPVN